MSIISVKNDTLGKDSFVNSQKPVPPTITGYTISGVDDTALDPAGGQTILINGNGFQRGATVVVDGTTVPVVSFINSNQLSFTSIVKSAGSYAIYVVNADLGTAIHIPGLIYSTLPTWTTGAGSLGSYYETTAISNTVVAGGDAPLTYALASGTLPSGATLSSGGVITGTSPVGTGSTTYSFTVEAIDAQLQSSTRSFSLTINTDVVTWSSPANNTTVALDGTAYSTTLSAASAAGYGVAYAANTLPAGLTLTGNTISGTPTVQDTTVSVLTATANTTGRSATNTVTWVVSLGDLFFSNTTLLLSGSANTFVSDSSTNNFPITVVGDTKPNNFNPYLTGWSNYFDGTGDNLSIPSNAALTLGTSNHTIEFWMYLAGGQSAFATQWKYSSGSTQQATNDYYFSAGSAGGATFGLLLGGGGSWAVNISNSASYTAALNNWTHIAITRSGNTFRLFANGVQVGSSGTYAGSITAQGGAMLIGQDGSSNFTTGYISNFRVVNGTALYTANFTPPTQPLTAVAGTSLLTCQSNRLRDASTNNFTITRNGDVAVSSFSPFVEPATTRGSAYFDGTGDYLTIPNNVNLTIGSGDFTIECWVYITGAQTTTYGWSVAGPSTNQGSTGWGLVVNRSVDSRGFGFICQNSFVSSDSIYLSAGEWVHLAVTRSGSGANNLKLFKNGVISSQTTYTTTDTYAASPVYIGADGTGTQAFPGYISNFRFVRGTAVYTAAFTPPTQPLTAITNTSLLTLQNNSSHINNHFVDSSGSNLLVTRAGNATQGSFSPYSPSGWSNYFDGSGDYLTLPSNQTQFSMGTGNFTIEMWVYIPSLATTRTLYDTMNSGDTTGTGRFAIQITTSGTVQVFTGAGATLTSGGTVTAGAWAHIAYAKASNSGRLYVNGIQVNTTYTDNNTYTVGSTNRPIIGVNAYDNSTNPMLGYISNLRVVKGIALYTANFTPSMQPLTAVAGTSLLTCCDNRFVDESPNNFTVTRVGDTRITNFAPHKAVVQTPQSYSAYFDGTGDYLQVPANSGNNFGTENFTIEAWIYPTASGNYRRFYSCTIGAVNIFLRQENTNTLRFYVDSVVDITSSTLLTLNTWNHAAIVRNGSAFTLYLNGTSVGTATNAGSMPVTTANATFISTYDGTNEPWMGYISNLRVVKGTAVYTANFTPPTSPLTAVSGTSFLTCQSATVVDNSTNRFAITATGNSQPTTVNPFGSTFTNSSGYTASEYSGSMYFDGTGDYLDLPNSRSIFSQQGTWTLECWVYPTVAQNNYLYSQVTSNFLQININASMVVNIDRSGVGNSITSTSPISLNAWTHLVLVSDGTNMRLFINGAQSGSTAAVGTQAVSAAVTRIGAYQSNGSLGYAGYVSNLRLVKGTALYTSNFVPPIAPVLPVPNTALLLNGTSAGITDAATKNVLETVGDIRITSAVSNFGSSSMRFDGAGDYVALPASPNFAFGTGNFTVEAWVNYVAPSNSGIFQIGSGIFPLTNGVGLGLDSGSRWMLYYANGSAAGTAFGPASNTWYHVAVVRNSGTTRVYLNGVSVMSVADATNYTGTFLGIGGIYSTSYLMNGYLQDFRVTNGTARYTANFTPPTAALQNK